MIQELVFEAPLNNLSLGNVSLNILKALHKKGVKVHYSPIGNADVGNYKLTDDFKNWLQSSANSFLRNYKRDIPTIKNWHINGSWHFPTDKRYLLTYHECDMATAEEINTVKNTNLTFFCGNYSQKIFNDYGISNCESFNLGFDSDSFYKTDKKYFDDGRIQFFLGAKMERRKKTLDILSIWAKKYGKKKGESYKPGEQQFFLNCCIINPFYDIKAQEQQIAQALNGQQYINIQFFSFLDRERFNDMLNSSDIDLTGLSGGESWNLIPFNISCLGKWSIVLNCSGMKAWANKDNCILVNPNGKVDSQDGIFFQKGALFNQGNFYSFEQKDVEVAMDLAVTKAKTPNVNGEKLATEFTYDKTVDYILNKIDADLNGK